MRISAGRARRRLSYRRRRRRDEQVIKHYPSPISIYLRRLLVLPAARPHKLFALYGRHLPPLVLCTCPVGSGGVVHGLSKGRRNDASSLCANRSNHTCTQLAAGRTGCILLATFLYALRMASSVANAPPSPKTAGSEPASGRRRQHASNGERRMCLCTLSCEPTHALPAGWQAEET